MKPSRLCPAEFAESPQSAQTRTPGVAAIALCHGVLRDPRGDDLLLRGRGHQSGALVEAGAEEWSIYTKDELQRSVTQNRVAPFSAAELRKVHEIKRTFSGRISS